MGLKSADALKAFCAELSEDRPSPGGGTASAGAGAMAASLLAMVCGVTARNKKHADRADALLGIRADLHALQEKLIENARLDAEAYDAVVLASRQRREDPGEKTESAFQTTLKTAADVPMSTAETCSSVLEAGIRVAEMGARSTWSDIGTALLLAEAGFNGAAMNVRINLDIISDGAYVKTGRDRIHELAGLSHRRFLEAMDRLQAGKRG